MYTLPRLTCKTIITAGDMGGQLHKSPVELGALTNFRVGRCRDMERQHGGGGGKGNLQVEEAQGSGSWPADVA